MNDQELFEIAAKLHNLRPDQLRLKKRYLDVVVIEKMDGAKFTYFVADLEKIGAGDLDDEEVTRLLAGEAQAATGPAVQPAKSHTRKR